MCLHPVISSWLRSSHDEETKRPPLSTRSGWYSIKADQQSRNVRFPTWWESEEVVAFWVVNSLFYFHVSSSCSQPKIQYDREKKIIRSTLNSTHFYSKLYYVQKYLFFIILLILKPRVLLSFNKNLSIIYDSRMFCFILQSIYSYSHSYSYSLFQFHNIVLKK